MIQQMPFQVFETHLQKECKLGFYVLGQNVKPCFQTISLFHPYTKLLVRLRPTSILCCCHLLTSLALSFIYLFSCSVFSPFTLIPTTILRFLIPRSWWTWFQKPNSHLLTTTSSCDSHMFPLFNVKEIPTPQFLNFFQSHQPLFGFSSFPNQPSPMFNFLTGFPTICTACF